MILHAVPYSGRRSTLPHIVWLHGFLGSHHEWQALKPHFSDWPQLYLDLPGHGGSAGLDVQSFAEVDSALRNTLKHHGINHYWLVGYSLGGRIAIYHASQAESKGLRGLVVEGGHPGLANVAEREARALNDARWAQRLMHEDFQAVLNAWYRQPVFHSLSCEQRADLVTLRAQNNPRALARMLEATSLARQPDLREMLGQLAVPFHFICGERDEKFRAVAAGLNCAQTLISGAGHNAHREAPAAFSSALLTLFRSYDL
ncbi:2-succinyl-6-hydroxy-2,4-cyclohexadiene-1-carboxylate synthase [Enterobacter sp. Cy-643]|uniref:2-succinyl-6-hydroxy-2, 4-cyclohexadiene-1-carboxylate synthase n=1 Tax=Enterobacter sp. Cy-643 TaxID=2608346 RepID=UPI00141F36DF|nr:2-succinyl-6-hydroxy-2,4-cyclohexadiene-1-carboxylate synthase [Enterobacter sp. Cy-643]NIF30944.1 2-succinyl-6-hydroxy-2,4-cyclohexadiene-1-carboxylate synthase [Enterobacter sp. Cy-643]